MRLSTPPTQRWFAVASLLAAVVPKLAAAQTPTADARDEAILNDIIEQYTTHVPTTCTTPVATSFESTWPGANPDSNWYAPFEQFEQDMFQTVMSHVDAGDRSWSIRIGTGGNIYSHFVPNLHGETMPPQAHDNSPFMDEVQQTISVNEGLNDIANAPYYIHQAGAYTEDGANTEVPFYSPSLARHCSGNSCTFASWGTQAWVPTKWTNPIIYINRYTNCDNGVIEHTQMIHNFADPLDSLSTVANVDQTYFNVGWGGPRPSNLPYVLEPDRATDTLSFDDVNDVDNMPICRFGLDDPGSAAGLAARVDTRQLKGYTTFVESNLLVNTTYPPIELWCRKATDPTCSDINTCMVPPCPLQRNGGCCTQATVDDGTYTRQELRVKAGQSPGCSQQGTNTVSSPYGNLIQLRCNFVDTGFGKTFPNLSGIDPCAPWTDVVFHNSRTKENLPVYLVKHWSFRNNQQSTFFAIYETDKDTAINRVNQVFSNVGFSEDLPIEVRSSSVVDEVPATYNPSALSAFTYVYGEGSQYSNGVAGEGRRRIGAADVSRDYTVFTVNWWRGSRLKPGETFSNRGYMFGSDLGSVEETAKSLRDKVEIEEVGQEQWSPRSVDIYRDGDSFVSVAATTAEGTATSCASAAATKACSGWSTPKAGHVPFFHVTCGAQSHVGPDPYHFTPDFGNRFPGHASSSATPVRSYLCDGQVNSIRPSWKMMGFFDPNETSCALLLLAAVDASYDDGLCEASADPPTTSPTKEPTDAPTSAPTNEPTDAPTSTPTNEPTPEPTNDPTDAPTTSAPTNEPTPEPTNEPTDAPTTSAPTNEPTPEPTSEATDAPTTSAPTNEPTPEPTNAPTDAPTTSAPTNEPTPEPTSEPTDAPTSAITSLPTPGPSPSPTPAPAIDDVTASPTFFTCAMFNAAQCADAYGGNQCQWLGSCHNCGCKPLPRS